MLQDMENECLSELQQTALVNFGGAPNWASATNPEFDRPTVDYRINQGFIKIIRDVSDIDVTMFTAIFLSVAQQQMYPLPPAVGSGNPNPPVGEVRRVFYQPVGLGYQLEMEPKIRMLPWKEFQRYTAAGYFNQFSYGTQPEICSVTPDRTQLAFYPSPANAGDTITLQYSPVPTAGTLVPLLSAETDEPFILPEDFQELIPIYATHKLWPKARALAAADSYLEQYDKKLAYIRGMWKRRHGGDQQRFTDVQVERATSGPWGWW